MAIITDRPFRRPIHALHAILLAFAFPLFLGALLSDWAYSASYQIQWTDFASWLIAGALVGSGVALSWALVDLIRGAGNLFYFVLLLAAWLLGLANAFVHAKDAYGAMPAGLILSVIVTLLALVASWIGYSGIADRRLK